MLKKRNLSILSSRNDVDRRRKLGQVHARRSWKQIYIFFNIKHLWNFILAYVRINWNVTWTRAYILLYKYLSLFLLICENACVVYERITHNLRKWNTLEFCIFFFFCLINTNFKKLRDFLCVYSYLMIRVIESKSCLNKSRLILLSATFISTGGCNLNLITALVMPRIEPSSCVFATIHRR